MGQDIEYINKTYFQQGDKKSDFQIAWELSQTKDKPFFIDTVRGLINQYDKEEISLSKLVEELNVSAVKWAEVNLARIEEVEKDNEQLRQIAKSNGYRICEDCKSIFKSNGRCPECSPLG